MLNMLKLNQGISTISIAFSLFIAPLSMAHAVSDEVAVQMLERLGELEQEISNLRGENETLRRELADIRTLQREGFLEVDERVSGLEKSRLPASSLNAGAEPAATSQAAGSAVLPPALEDPITATQPLPAQGVGGGTIVATPSQATIRPTVPTVTATINNTDTMPQVADQNIAAQRRAVAPVNAERNTDPTNKADQSASNSYYYYGTQDKNQDAVPDTNTSKASLIEKQPTIPDAHKAKAAYNQAYKLLVNDPKSAVPAFRDFMINHPEHELVANAQYWLGEALYAQKDYAGATEEFMQVLKEHKGSPKAPGAALKLGYSFYELRQWDFARRTLEDTVRFFPDTNAAKLATNRLTRMKTEGR